MIAKFKIKITDNMLPNIAVVDSSSQPKQITQDKFVAYLRTLADGSPLNYVKYFAYITKGIIAKKKQEIKLQAVPTNKNQQITGYLVNVDRKNALTFHVEMDIPDKYKADKLNLEVYIYHLNHRGEAMISRSKQLNIPINISLTKKSIEHQPIKHDSILKTEQSLLDNPTFKQDSQLQQDISQIEEVVSILAGIEEALRQAHDSRAKYALAAKMKELPELLKAPELKFSQIKKALIYQLRKLSKLKKDLESESASLDQFRLNETPELKLKLDALLHTIRDRNIKLRQTILNLELIVIDSKDKPSLLTQFSSSVKAINKIMKNSEKFQQQVKSGATDIIKLFDSLIYYMQSIRDKLINAKNMFAVVQRYSSQTQQEIENFENQLTMQKAA
ncbi:MAG: hypothetical protein ACMXYG_05975 [Candidatus Woesearchaeota archaeon]